MVQLHSLTFHFLLVSNSKHMFLTVLTVIQYMEFSVYVKSSDPLPPLFSPGRLSPTSNNSIPGSSGMLPLTRDPNALTICLAFCQIKPR